MKKYVVTLREVVFYTVTVEAEDEDDAGMLAEEAWAASDTPDADFDGCSDGVEARSVIEAEPNPSP